MTNCQNCAIHHPAIVTRASNDNGLMSFSYYKDEPRRDTEEKEFAFEFI